MSRYHERATGLITPNILTAESDDIGLGDIGAADTFTLTLTEVGSPATVSTTGAITFDASTTTLQGNIQTALRAVTGYATSTVAWQSAQIYRLVLSGTKTGTDSTVTITSPTTFTPGAVTNVVQGSSAFTGTIPIGRFAVVKRIRLEDFNDNSLDVAITDSAARTVYSRTAVDTSTADLDVPSDEYVTADGRAGEDGAAAANTSGGLFEGPLSYTVTQSVPTARGVIKAFVDMGNPSGSAFKLRRTGTFLGATASVNLGATVGNIKRIVIDSVSDTAVAIAVADAYSKNIYTQSSANFTTAVDVGLSHAGVDQAGNAVADLLDVVVKSPVTVTLTGHDGTGFSVDFYVET
jgi:hypothetical protein